MPPRKKNTTAPPDTTTKDAAQIDAFAAGDDVLTDEQQLIAYVRNNPGKYNHLRVYQLERTFVSATGLPKYQRRSEIGRHDLAVLLNPGIYPVLSQTYGGGDGVGFDVMLVEPSGTLGPSKRFWSQTDARPNAGTFLAGQGNPYGQGGALYVNPFDKQAAPVAPSSSLAETLLVTLLPMMFQQAQTNQQNAADATAEGVRKGMELAREIAEARQPPTTSQTSEIAGAVVQGLGHFVDLAKTHKAQGGPVSTTTRPRLPPPDPVGDPVYLGWVVVTSEQQGWPVHQTARTLTAALGGEQVARVLENPESFKEILTTAANAYAPLKAYDDTDGRMRLMVWSRDVFNYLASDDDDQTQAAS